MSNSSIWPIDWTLSGTTTLGNKRVLHISQSSKTGTSKSDGLSRTLVEWGGLTPLQRCNLCILQTQTTGLQNWNLTTRCSLVTYSEQLPLLGAGGFFYPYVENTVTVYSKPYQQWKVGTNNMVTMGLLYCNKWLLMIGEKNNL